MILNASHNDGLAIQVLENAPKILVQFFSQCTGAQERPAFFGGKDRVDEDFGKGLRHAPRVTQARSRRNSLKEG